MRAWDYLFIDQPAGCITMGNSVSMDISLYVRGNLCLDNNSQIDSSVVNVIGSVSVYNSAQIGSPGAPISEFSAIGQCSYSGAPTSCGPPARIYAASVGTSPPVIPKPTVDLPYWYANAQLGPQSPCSSGSFPGGFDNDTTLNVSRGEIDLTPASAYDCRKVDGSGNLIAQIAWQPGSPGTLTIKGVIYFDAHLGWSNLNLIQYDGKGVVSGSGQVRIKNRASLCGVPACDETWTPSGTFWCSLRLPRLAGLDRPDRRRHRQPRQLPGRSLYRQRLRHGQQHDGLGPGAHAPPRRSTTRL